jgi:four helix bundle protein
MDHDFKKQITRSGLSIPSNIAEGFERETLHNHFNRHTGEETVSQ